ncbi:MAG TPA: helix-turn-helix domain-containing protein [Acidimicrobiia bacterium]|nr:helix-turn-helix domain-containing protein [Acidimicrobiia bacterium]
MPDDARSAPPSAADGESYKSTTHGASQPGRPAEQRELRAQGRRTLRRLLDAGLRVFARRGYHAARVDDVVRAARTSHGTFYLYFSNKEDLLRALAVDCADELTDLASDVGPIGPDAAGRAELHRFLGRFLDIYRHYGPVIRAWMEDQVGDRHVDRLGVRAFTAIGERLALRMREGGQHPPAGQRATVGALMALLERFSYGVASGRIAADDGALDTLTTVVHRGFFGAAVPAA